MNLRTEFKYRALISDSHQDNWAEKNRWGDWLHELAKHFKVPRAANNVNRE